MKKSFQMYCKPDVHKRLKILAAINSITIGGVIESLVNFSEAGQHIKDQASREAFNEALEVEFIQATVRDTKDFIASKQAAAG